MASPGVSFGAESAVFGRLYAELWISFVALMRSYAAAHDIGRVAGTAQVKEGEDGQLSLRSEGRTLALKFDAADGTGSWSLYEDDPAAERLLERGRFRMGDDSRVELSDRLGKLDLEIAAEAFTAMVFEE